MEENILEDDAITEEIVCEELVCDELVCDELVYEELVCDELEEKDIFMPSDIASTMSRLVIERSYKKSTEDICAICLDTMYQKKCEYLPCKHVFHYACLKTLIETRTYTCPLCRYDFKTLLTTVGVDVPEEVTDNYVLTIFTNMDLYGFILEMLWQSYNLEY
jgi:hypothetical protein